MAIVDHRNANGTVYVYEQRSVWDKEKKCSCNKQVCIGKRDVETGEIIYNERYSTREATKAAATGEISVKSVVIGQSLVLDKAAKRCGITKTLRAVFEKTAVERLISLAYAVVADSGKMYHAASWMESHACPCLSNPLDAGTVTRFLESITKSDVETFLRAWIETKADRKGLYCFDITSISSYAKGLSGVEWGYNRDKEKLPQINLALLTGITSGLPVLYEDLPGSLPDVCAVHKLTARLEKYGLGRIVLLLDRGFLSEANITELMESNTKFMMPLRSDLTLSGNLIDSYREDIEDMDNIIEINDMRDAAIYATTKVAKLAGKRIWYHIYYDTLAKEASLLRLFEKIAVCERELKSGELEKSHAELYEKYFIVKETPKRGYTVKRNMDEIKKYKTDYAGFWVIATNAEKDASAALKAYRKRNDVECHFKDLKDELDMDRLRMHSDATVAGRLFVQFIALVILEQVREVVQSSKLPKSLTISEMFRRLGSYQKMEFSGKYRPITSTPTKIQRKIFDVFDIPYGAR
jgi:transposase